MRHVWQKLQFSRYFSKSHQINQFIKCIIRRPEETQEDHSWGLPLSLSLLWLLCKSNSDTEEPYQQTPLVIVIIFRSELIIKFIERIFLMCVEGSDPSVKNETLFFNEGSVIFILSESKSLPHFHFIWIKKSQHFSFYLNQKVLQFFILSESKSLSNF